MAKAYFGIGASLPAMISGLSSLSESQGAVWLPLMFAFLGVLPIAAGLANTFVDGESAAS